MAILAKTQNYIELCFSYNVGFTSGRLQQKCGDRFDLAVCIAACIDETFKSDGEVCTTFVPVTHSALPSILPDVCVCVCVCVCVYELLGNCQLFTLEEKKIVWTTCWKE